MTRSGKWGVAAIQPCHRPSVYERERPHRLVRLMRVALLHGFLKVCWSDRELLYGVSGPLYYRMLFGGWVLLIGLWFDEDLMIREKTSWPRPTSPEDRVGVSNTAASWESPVEKKLQLIRGRARLRETENGTFLPYLRCVRIHGHLHKLKGPNELTLSS